MVAQLKSDEIAKKNQCANIRSKFTIIKKHQNSIEQIYSVQSIGSIVIVT